MTTEPCPECGQPLHAKLEAGLVTLWCAYGPCPSCAANDGTTAPTAEEAYADLAQKVEAEYAEREQQRKDLQWQEND